ncbi:hypothetical protein HAZT_HAZT008154 [Hyalella azteca]|uniref:Ig-like domain-containing protein n=1 Tax=Hyalella azteca TaxID=294128 RepID=A0A6A0HAG2_HYAAZ|nr:hypothetical protein HAZT_HAZT008154 [Hyalella azteca]
MVQLTCLITSGDNPVTIAWYKSYQHPNKKHILFNPETVLNQHSVLNQNSVLDQNSAPNQSTHQEYFQSDGPFSNTPLVDTPPPSSHGTLGAVTGVDGSLEEKKNGGLVENHPSGENRVGMEVSGVNQGSDELAANAFSEVKLDGELVDNYPITDNRVIKEVLQSLQYSNALGRHSRTSTTLSDGPGRPNFARRKRLSKGHVKSNEVNFEEYPIQRKTRHYNKVSKLRGNITVPSQLTPSLLEVPRKNGGTFRTVDGLPRINGEMSHNPEERQPNNGEMHFVVKNWVGRTLIGCVLVGGGLVAFIRLVFPYDTNSYPRNLPSLLVTPEILPFAFPSEVQEGQLLQVSCAVTKGDDPLTLQWFKDNEPLESSPSFVINTIQSKLSVLLLTSVGADHSGVYGCKATNPYGEAYLDSPLYVHGDFMLIPPRGQW